MKNWKLNSAVLVLMALSLLSIASVKPDFFWKQFLFFALGWGLVFLLIKFDWRPFVEHRLVVLGIYFLIILLLIITYFFAPVVRGHRSWLNLGPFQFQSSEFAKAVLILILADFFRKEHIKIARTKTILASFFYFLILAGFIALSSDLGSVLILFSIWFGFLLVSGIPWKNLLAAVLIFAAIGVFSWFTVLKNYQRERIVSAFAPERDLRGASYNVIQSKIAIGSGGWFGKGFRQGTQVQLKFLPEAHTDFIFAAIVEEFGLAAGLLILFALGAIIWEILKIGIASNNNFSRFICLGAAIFLSAQFFINISNSLALLPVIGETFPFLSYGGSGLLANFLALGLVESISGKS